VFTIIQAGVSSKWVNDSQRILLGNFDTIHNSPSHLYHYALPFSPSSSWLHKCYSAELSQEVKVVKGLSAGWEACSRTVKLDTPWALGCWKDTIAVGLKSSHIILLDGITGSQMAVLSGHTDWVTSVAFSSDGTSLASGSHDETLKLWDVQTGGIIRTFHGHTNWVLSISTSYTTIASGSADRTIRLWDIQTGECHHIISKQGWVTCVSFSPTNSQHLISISGGVIQWWDIDGHQIKPAHKGSYTAFSLDGTHFALCGREVTMVHSSDSGEIVAKFPTDSDNLKDVDADDYCCFSPDSRLVAVAAGSTAYVWDITGSDPHLIETFIGHTSRIASLIFFSSSSLISASDDQSVKFWQIGGSSTDLVASDPDTTPPAPALIRSISLQTESGITISSDSDGVVKMWDISTGLCKASFQIPARGDVSRDAQMIDGRLVVVWGGHEGIHIWDTKEGKLLQVMEADSYGCRDIKISGDGSKVFLLKGESIKAWSMWTGEMVGEVELGDNSYLDLFRLGGSRICLRFPDSLTQGWDFGISGSSPVPLPNISSERPRLEFTGGSDWWYEGPSLIKDTVTGNEVFQLFGKYASPYKVQWDGRYLVACYRSGELLILDFNQMLPQ
jgi:WD40 repeat protein